MSDLRRFDLSQRVAIVTGGNGGIGLGMARTLAAAGARVVVAARNAAKSEAAVGELRALGGEPLAITADVSDERSVDALIAEAVGRCGRLDILVNNAGTNIRKPAHELSLEEWRRVLDTNLTSAFLCARAAEDTRHSADPAPRPRPRRRNYRRSMIVPVPSPPPQHIAISP